MKLRKKCLAVIMAMTMVLPFGLSGCGKKDKDDATTGATTENASAGDASTEGATEEVTDSKNFVEIALHVLYNDADKNFTDEEVGESIKVSEDGQYTLSFDCSKDLSDAAKSAGIDSLTNLTAIFIKDVGVANDAQSPITACNIKWDKVVVDGTELTITKPDPKSAIKSSGIFDTNDPINGWDGSAVEEAAATGEHVANFTTIENPKTIEVTFTLSEMSFDAAGSNGNGDGAVVSTNTYVNSQKYSDIDFSGMNALEFTKYLGNGINLGNTMEAFNTGFGTNLDVSKYEQAWGQPETTKEMIIAMKNCGFDTLRVPVSWTNMMDWENGNFTIDAAYLDRVEEIVKWAIDAEMFVIVNDHYDKGWWSMFGSSEKDTVDTAWKIYESIWTQVSDRFKDYSDMLILESANEELGQFLNDTSTCKTSGNLSTEEIYQTITAINQKFVDIVRASGGNNDDRFLLIAGNNTDIEKTIDELYVMPKDTVEGKLLISVHYYAPTNYCLDKDIDTNDEDVLKATIEGYKWGLKEDYEYMTEQLGKMKKFTEAGYGVIIGEYGALPLWNKATSTSHEIACTIDYTNELLNVCDVNNFCPVLWSTGAFDKKALNMLSDEQTKLYTSRCYAEESAKGDSYLSDVQKNIDDLTAAALDVWPGQETYEPGTSVAWIMWNGGAGTYSVGDKFNAADNTAGITATNAVIEGAGEYTISLDFAGGNNGLTFSAIGIADGEINYPGAVIDIKEITADGKPLTVNGKFYTSSDDKKCTRVNLYNQWVSDKDIEKNLSKEDCNFRTADGDTSGITAIPIDPKELVGIKNITITFDFIVKE